MKKVYVLGIGQTVRGRFPRKGIGQLATEATFAALDNADMDTKDIDFVWLSHYPVNAHMQSTAGQVIVDALGMSTHVGCIPVEEACAASGLAAHDCYLAVASGRYDAVLCVGVSKQFDSLSYLNCMAESGYNPFLINVGITLGINGLQNYIMKYKVTEEDMYSWYENAYWYATKNPDCMLYKKKTPTFKDYMARPYKEYPLRWGIGPTDTDGAAAVIFASEEVVKKYGDDSRIYVAGIAAKEESSYYPHSHNHGAEFTGMHSASLKSAFAELFKVARVRPEDLDVFQPQMVTLMTSYTHIDMLGHPDIPIGHAPKWFTEQESKPGGKLPIATEGQPKSGYVPGAVVLHSIIENVYQLNEEAGSRQCPMRNYCAAFSDSPLRPVVGILRRER